MEQKKQQLRVAFLEYCRMNFPWEAQISERLADYWIPVAEQLLADKVETVRKEIVEMTGSTLNEFSGDGFVTTNMRAFGKIVLQDILSLPSLSPSSHKENSDE